MTMKSRLQKCAFKRSGPWVLLLTGAIAGCATPPPATQAVTPLSFDYKPGPKAKDTGHAIAFVNAKASTTDPSGAGVTVRVQSGNVGAWAPRSPQLEAALSQTIAQIVSNRGFRTMGPFNTDDDLTFVDKKAAYLASTPELIYAVERADQVKRCDATNCNETGNFVVTGKLVLRLVEPMTKQSLLNKTINLTDFGISQPYTMNYAAPVQAQQAKPSGGLLGALIAAGAPAKPDNWRDPYNKAVNEFFSKAVVKIESHFDREEIVRLEPTVLELKGLKRF
jgi:Neuraminyllactose-binding hemagglutinin precursor (NLBH)